MEMSTTSGGGNLGLNVAAAFRNSTENRRLLAKLRGNIIIHDDTNAHSAGASSFMGPSKSNSHRKFSLDEYIIIGNAVLSTTFETATISVLDIRLSVGELLSVAFHNGISKVVESLTNDEHERRQVVEDACKVRVNELLSAKEWSEFAGEVPAVTVTWPYEVLLELIQCFKSDQHVTDSLLTMWHGHNLNLRKLSTTTLSKTTNAATQLSSKQLPSSDLFSIDEDLAIRISNRRRIGRSRFCEKASEKFVHHISGLRARVKKKNSPKAKLELAPSSSVAAFSDARALPPMTPEPTTGEPSSSVFTRLLQASPRDRFLKLRKAAEVTIQHHLLRVPEPITPFEVHASVRAEVHALLLAPRFSGNRLGVWTLNKESKVDESSTGHGTKAMRRNAKDMKRPASADTTTTDLDAALEAERSKDVILEHPEFPVSMNLLADVFKNRFG